MKPSDDDVRALNTARFTLIKDSEVRPILRVKVVWRDKPTEQINNLNIPRYNMNLNHYCGSYCEIKF
jgi:hypothetical protein